MHKSLGLYHAAEDRVATAQRRTFAFLNQRGWRVICGREAKHLPIAQIHIAEVRFADADRIRQHRLEHWLQVAGRCS